MKEERKNNKIYYGSIIIAIIIILSIGVSYAWFTLEIVKTPNLVTTGTLQIKYDQGNYIDTSNIKPATEAQVLESYKNGSCIYKQDREQGITNEHICAYNTFTITNTGSINTNVFIDLIDVTNTYTSSYLRYKLLENEPQELVGYVLNQTRLASNVELQTSKSKTFTLLVWLDENAENPDMEKEYRAKINVFGRETSYVTPEEYFSLNANIDISTLNIVDNNKCANFIFNLFKNHNNIEDSKNYCSDIGDSNGNTFKNDIKDAQDSGEYFPAGLVQEMINKNIINCSYEPIISHFYNGDFYEEYGKEIDVVIPKQFIIYTLEVKENPTIEDINNCITSMKGDDYSEQDAITICNGGEVSGTSLETLRLELYYMPLKMIEKEYSMYKFVPAITKKIKVTKLTNMFTHGNIKSIIIPEGVTEIGSYAFSQNQLTDIVLPSTLQKIGEQAFYDNYINEIIIPDNVELIGEHAFAFNNITRVEMGNSIKKIGKWSFASNTISNLNLKESKNDTTIDEYAFAYNEIPNLSIPNSTVSIGEYAFYYNDLNTIYIGSKSKLIENDGISGAAFYTNDKYLYKLSYSIGNSKYAPTTYYNNIELSTVYNNSGKVFDWKNIFGSYIYNGNGITGVVKINDNRQINIITGENP